MNDATMSVQVQVYYSFGITLQRDHTEPVK